MAMGFNQLHCTVGEVEFYPLQQTDVDGIGSVAVGEGEVGGVISVAAGEDACHGRQRYELKLMGFVQLNSICRCKLMPMELDQLQRERKRWTGVYPSQRERTLAMGGSDTN